ELILANFFESSRLTYRAEQLRPWPTPSTPLPWKIISGGGEEKIAARIRNNQTRRRLRGRQPLCGIGVTSRIDVTMKPAACNARSADSRPEPGPETSTSSVRMPCSCAFLAASSPATCAANGVDLREPLKPLLPDDA